jgi:predicted nucleotidyltransferase
MTYGLTEDTLQKMAGVFAGMPKLEEVILYGSRAIGNYQAGSDIDLGIPANTPAIFCSVSSVNP